jgi:hypothetical protein
MAHAGERDGSADAGVRRCGVSLVVHQGIEHVAQGFEALGRSFWWGGRPHQDGRGGANRDYVLVLGLIVLIRTFLSFSLEIEISGVPPWRRALASGAGTLGRATSTALHSVRSRQGCAPLAHIP